MKTRLLKKIRKRILSIDYSNEDFAIIKYLNKYGELAEDTIRASKGFFEHWSFMYFLYDMFDRDSSFIILLKYFHEKHNQKRAKKRILLQLKRRKKIEYIF